MTPLKTKEMKKAIDPKIKLQLHSKQKNGKTT